MSSAGPRLRSLLACVCLALVACERVASSLPQRRRPAIPRVKATVLTYHTTVLPKGKGVVHRVMVAGQKGRLGDEIDRWRLFDFAANTVTVVDDIEKTYKTEPVASLMRTRRALVSRPLPYGVPEAEILATGFTRTFAEVDAKQFVIRAGAYRRELWLSIDEIVPPGFFAMMLATDSLSEPNAPMMRRVVPRLLREKGFPVFDRTDMPVDGETFVVEKKLLKIETLSLPASWFAIPPDYVDLDAAARESAAGRRSASSPPPGRKIPAME